MENNNAQQLLEDYLKNAREYDQNQAELLVTDEYKKYKGIKTEIEDKTAEEYKEWAKNNKKANEEYNKIQRRDSTAQRQCHKRMDRLCPDIKGRRRA